MSDGALVRELGHAPSVALGPDDAPDDALLHELVGGEDDGYEVEVPGLRGALVAYEDTDGTGGWTPPDTTVARLCAGGLTWVEPDVPADTAHAVDTFTHFRTGWTVSPEPSGEHPVDPADEDLQRWCE